MFHWNSPRSASRRPGTSSAVVGRMIFAMGSLPSWAAPSPEQRSMEHVAGLEEGPCNSRRTVSESISDGVPNRCGDRKVWNRTCPSSGGPGATPGGHSGTGGAHAVRCSRPVRTSPPRGVWGHGRRRARSGRRSRSLAHALDAQGRWSDDGQRVVRGGGDLLRAARRGGGRHATW